VLSHRISPNGVITNGYRAEIQRQFSSPQSKVSSLNFFYCRSSLQGAQPTFRYLQAYRSSLDKDIPSVGWTGEIEKAAEAITATCINKDIYASSFMVLRIWVHVQQFESGVSADTISAIQLLRLFARWEGEPKKW